MTDAAVTDPCPVCGMPAEDGDQFCESCGAPLHGGPVADDGPGDADRATARPSSDSVPTAPAPVPRLSTPCVGCGAPSEAIDPDGYCTVCGRRQPGPRDHQETDLGWAAAVSDRGRHHPRNEDAYFLDVVGQAALVAVVCDGVSSSVQPDAASQAAADAAGVVLAESSGSGAGLVEATVEALAAAQKAVAALPWVSHDDLASPSCTFVSATCRAGQVAIGWAGDSRAYWIGDRGVRQLTVDNSWAESQVAAGLMTELEADADPRSHAITRWLGADAPEDEAQTVSFPVDQPGRLLVCSDGLWNYAPTESQMAEVVLSAPAAVTAIGLARALTTFALDAGGHDNITVVVIDLKENP